MHMNGYAHDPHECMCEVWNQDGVAQKLTIRMIKYVKCLTKMQVRHDSHMTECDVELHNVHD